MRKGFTLIEMIFVIVIFGIMSKFGAELLYKIYESYIYSNTLNRLQNQTELTVKQIANRLQYRIKDSTIARKSISTVADYKAIGSVDETYGATAIEWIGVDINGWRGDKTSTAPLWSGFIDLAASLDTNLSSPGTRANLKNYGLFFIGSEVDLESSSFGWDGTNLKSKPANITNIKVVETSKNAIARANKAKNFKNSDVFEYYQLAETAYAVSLDKGTRKLYLYSGYKPWLGQKATKNGKKSLLMENVSSFKFTSMGDILVIQVCASDDNVTGLGEYAICKEKAVF